jgi:hypothetical protein
MLINTGFGETCLLSVKRTDDVPAFAGCFDHTANKISTGTLKQIGVTNQQIPVDLVRDRKIVAVFWSLLCWLCWFLG